PLIATELSWLLAWAAVQARDFETAARELAGITVRKNLQPTVLLKIMLTSLGALRHSRGEMNGWIDEHLAGISRDLAAMFLGKKEPLPGKLWPHARWLPQFRLMLALWLEARGRAKAAHAVALPSRDRRYGQVNAQPAIEALLKRTAGRSAPGHA